MRKQCVEGDYAYILWSAETADNSYEAATDTFVVRNGKIVAQSFAAKITPKREQQSEHVFGSRSVSNASSTASQVK